MLDMTLGYSKTNFASPHLIIATMVLLFQKCFLLQEIKLQCQEVDSIQLKAFTL